MNETSRAGTACPASEEMIEMEDQGESGRLVQAARTAVWVHDLKRRAREEEEACQPRRRPQPSRGRCMGCWCQTTTGLRFEGPPAFIVGMLQMLSDHDPVTGDCATDTVIEAARERGYGDREFWLAEMWCAFRFCPDCAKRAGVEPGPYFPGDPDNSLPTLEAEGYGLCGQDLRGGRVVPWAPPADAAQDQEPAP